MAEIKRFIQVLLVAELAVILFIVVPTVGTYFLLKYIGLWAILGAICLFVPYVIALIDYIRRNQ